MFQRTVLAFAILASATAFNARAETAEERQACTTDAQDPLRGRNPGPREGLRVPGQEGEPAQRALQEDHQLDDHAGAAETLMRPGGGRRAAAPVPRLESDEPRQL